MIYETFQTLRADIVSRLPLEREGGGCNIKSSSIIWPEIFCIQQRRTYHEIMSGPCYQLDSFLGLSPTLVVSEAFCCFRAGRLIGDVC